MTDNDTFDENRERQEAEFEFIQAAYLPEEAWIAVEQRSTNSDKNGDAAAPIKRIYRRLQLPIHFEMDGTPSASISVELVLTLPPSYPTDEAAFLQVDASLSNTKDVEAKTAKKISASHRKSAINALPLLLQSCRTVAIENAGSESVFLVLSNAETWIEEEWANCLESDGNDVSTAKQSTSCNRIDRNILGRKLIFSHHIIAKSKRKAIGDLAKEYNLGGYFKIGWPGIIVIEGREEDCQSFYDEIRTMRWQYLVVRGEEREEIGLDDQTNNLDDLRRFPISMTELGEDKMSHLSELCRDVGLEDLFLTSMKIYKQENEEVGERDEILEASATKEDVRYGTLVLVDHMNDPKGYSKWLQKACKSAGCSCLILRCFPNDDGGTAQSGKSRARPIIVVGLIGEDESSLKQVLKRWRTSRVDVDSKGNPCLERMMDVLVEGALESQDADENGKSTTTETPNGDGWVSRNELESTLKRIGGLLWLDAFHNAAQNRQNSRTTNSLRK